MAKKSNINDKEINYKINRIRPVMDRSELDKLCVELKSDDDFINYHLNLVDDTSSKHMVVIMNDEFKSPKKNTNEERSYGFMKPVDASEFLNEYIDEGKANSKAKEVMRSGYSKKSQDKYKQIVEQEAKETAAINTFTKPSFEDVLNNVYVNVYNGQTYNDKDEDLPDDLRDNVGFTIPGVIDTIEDYFEFVKRLKDRGKGGLGRSIYERYEDYEEACDLIEQYKEALFNKYGGQDEYFAAKDLGGMFGAYEYYPTVRPRFKKTSRNIKLDKGINLNELASVKDMGARIWAFNAEEIEGYDIEHSYVEYEQTPPKYKDLPDDLQMMYKNDKSGHSAYDMIKSFKKIEQYANELIRSGVDKDIEEGYDILDKLYKEEIANRPYYESDFVDILDDINDLTIQGVIGQLDYDKMLYQTDYDVNATDNLYDVTDSLVTFKKYMKEYIADVQDLDVKDPVNKANIEDMADYATRYMFDPRFKMLEDDKAKLNSAGDVLYKNNRNTNITSSGDRIRENSRSNESKIQAYVRELASSAKASLDMLSSNADTNDYAGNTAAMSINDVTSYNTTIDTVTNGFSLEPKAKALVKYMVGNELLAKRIYELSADKGDEEMFSPRTGLSEFIDKAQVVTKPFMTENMIDLALKNNKRGGLINE